MNILLRANVQLIILTKWFGTEVEKLSIKVHPYADRLSSIICC